MLLFASSTAAECQPIAGLATFRDHLAPNLAYYLPAGLELLPAADGDPDFFLLRYHGDLAEAMGGLLHFTLGFSPLAPDFLDAAALAGLELRMANIQAARFRLHLRSLHEDLPDQVGEWRLIQVSSRVLIAPSVSLNAHETQFLETLLSGNMNVVEVEMEFCYAGLVSGTPWLVTINAPMLMELLTALLPVQPVRADEIVAAFLSLPNANELLSWQALEMDVAEPNHELVLRELALRSLDSLFEREAQESEDPFSPHLYRLRPPAPFAPLAVSWDLIPARQESRTFGLNWSLLPLVQTLDTPEKRRKLFPSVDRVSPFGKVDIHVINRVPFDSRFLRKATVDLRYSGTAGVPEFRSFTFDGTSDLARFSVFYPAVIADFQLAARFTTVQAAPNGGWPKIQRGEFLSVPGTVVEVSRSALGMDFVWVEAEPVVFTKVASIRVLLFAADQVAADQTEDPPSALTPLVEVSLTAEDTSASVALPSITADTQLYMQILAQITAQSPTPSDDYDLRSGKVTNRKVYIFASEFEVLDPDRIRLQLDPQVADFFALVRVTVASLVDEGRIYRLDAGQTVTVNFFRSSVFEPLRYRYRIEYSAFDSEGEALPTVVTDWSETQERDLLVSPPTSNSG